MLKTILKVMGILVLVIFQLAIMSKLFFWGAIADLILILAIILTIKNHFQDAILVAIVGGFFLDLTSSLRFGFFMIMFLAILLIINFLVLKNLPSTGNLTTFLIFLGSFLFLDLTSFLLIRVWPTWQVFLTSFVNSGWAILIYSLIGHKITAEEKIKII